MTGDANGDANGPAAYLDGLSPNAAARELRRCCGSERWASEMAARRPFGSDAALFVAAEDVWWDLEPDDWLEAFAAHPRIGERGGGAWSAEEQAGMGDASRRLEAEIREGNRAYEAKFGHVFLICATGLTAAEMAAALDRRLDNDPEAELRIAAAEQAKITKLRLGKLGAE
ncbi:MAG: 2-oxo-4-hydroxy-4-carboxy-5-ureidoimidazoline decarboxylase [Gemmatimonadota bacterium]